MSSKGLYCTCFRSGCCSSRSLVRAQALTIAANVFGLQAYTATPTSVRSIKQRASGCVAIQRWCLVCPSHSQDRLQKAAPGWQRVLQHNPGLGHIRNCTSCSSNGGGA